MISSFRMLQIALVGGIVYLASNGLEGWGWLVFILFITLENER
jgi:hypothetical protein